MRAWGLDLHLCAKALNPPAELRGVVHGGLYAEPTGRRAHWSDRLVRTQAALGQMRRDAGRHARSAVGMGSLPMGIPVEIECIVEVGPARKKKPAPKAKKKAKARRR